MFVVVIVIVLVVVVVVVVVIVVSVVAVRCGKVGVLVVLQELFLLVEDLVVAIVDPLAVGGHCCVCGVCRVSVRVGDVGAVFRVVVTAVYSALVGFRVWGILVLHGVRDGVRVRGEVFLGACQGLAVRR